MTQEELEQKIAELEGEINVTSTLLNFFIDVLVRTGTPEVVKTFDSYLAATLVAAKGAMDDTRYKGFARRHAFFKRRFTKTLENLNTVNGGDGQ